MSGIYAILSNHGFGHLSRSAQILSEFQDLRPNLPLFVASTRPPDLAGVLFRPGMRLRPVALDPGVVSSDSLSFDPGATLRVANEFRKKEPDLIKSESKFVREQDIDLIVSDIAPLAAVIARETGRPCWMWGNFGWDDIYRGWGGPLVAEAERMADMYSLCDSLFRLPFHTAMSAFPRQVDTGCTGRPTRLAPERVREELGLDERPLVLLAFGGLGLDQAPFDPVSKLTGFQFVTFVDTAPDLPNLRVVRGGSLQPRDLLPLTDRLISKPGYAMFCEVLQNPVPFYCLEREGWAETPLLLEALRTYFTHRVVTPGEFFEGNWEFLLEAAVPPLAPPPPLNGNDEILTRLTGFFA